MKYAFIQRHRKEHKVVVMCKLMNVSPSGFYGWASRPTSERTRKHQRLATKLKAFYAASYGTYGSPRLYADLNEDGEQTSPRTVARLMAKYDIKARTARRFIVTTDSKNTMAPARDLVRRQFSAKQPNQVWVSDTTFIRTRQGWLFLAVILDLYSRHIVGWSMSDRNNTQLVCDAFMMAVKRRGEPKNLILHSDQGSTYASVKYHELLKQYQARCSMSRKGECLDNAVAESFFASLKTEWVDELDYHSREQARQSVFKYIEVFYNRRRRHSFLNQQSPVAFEAVNDF